MQDSKMFLSMHKVPFARRQSFMGFYLGDLAEESFGMPEIWFGSTRGGASIQGRNNNLMKLSLILDGETIPYSLSSTPAELILASDHGTVRICIGEEKLIRITGDGEVGLRFYWPIVGKHSSGKHEDARDMMDGSWQACFNFIANFLFVPINANMDCEAPWNWRETFSEFFRCDFTPSGKGSMEIAVEEFPDFNGKKRDSYPSYAACVANVEASFQEFLDTTAPEIKNPELAKLRDQAAYTSWSHLIGPEKKMLRTMMQMMRVYFPFSFGWQQAYQAACLSRNMDLAWSMLQAMFDHQLPDGHIPEYVTDFHRQDRITKPCLQGFVILWLMEHGDMSKVSKQQIEELYYPLCKWTEWWMTERAPTGLPQFDHADESGWDDATVYIKPSPTISPELPCYVVLQMEAQAKMAEILGLDKEAKDWYARSKALLDLTIERLWNGKQFVGLRPAAGEVLVQDNIVNYQPLILGKRLPQDIIDKLVADLKVEGDYLTPYGLASERLDSPYVDPYQGWMNGPIVSPLHFQMVIGLDECGEKEFAREVATRFCKNCVENGPYHIINPFNGKGQDKGRDSMVHQHWSSWSTSIFLFLASHYCD